MAENPFDDDCDPDANLNYWRLCEDLTISQAALLLVGEDPADNTAYIEQWDIHNRPRGYEAAKTAITRALINGVLDGSALPELEYDSHGQIAGELDGTVDPHRSWISVAALKRWLVERGFNSGFFFPNTREGGVYADPDHERYAPKLAAAVAAWNALGDPSDLGGKSPKDALKKWLRKNASQFDLCDEDGKPNETGIEEIAKVANWKRGGGAPKTPSK